MSGQVLLLVLLNFGAVGVLTKAFFQRTGRLTWKWWATAAPLLLCPPVLIAAFALHLRPVVPSAYGKPLATAAVVFSAASIALMSATWGTHRTPIALWHQQDDRPQQLVTCGAYRRIRHPFYASYLLLFLAAFALFPHWATLGLLGYMLVAVNITAAGEERRLSDSPSGQEYQHYAARTGRFVPRVWARPARVPPTRREARYASQGVVAVPARERSRFAGQPGEQEREEPA
jgi:protein-S-isoprenylcysteine O-methyltransferase Ste14